MALTLGIRNFYRIAANIVRTSNAVLATVGLTSPIAANETQKLTWWVPIQVGAAGGVRFQVVVPGGGVSFISTIELYDTVAPLMTPAAQTASAAFTNALANAGTHWFLVQATIVNGATAGNVDLQVAQNTSNAASLTILAGGTLDVVKG